MNEIILIAIALLIGVALGYLPRKNGTEKPDIFKSAFSISGELRALISEAASLVEKQNSIDSSGESKRHQVYAQMIKNHPQTPRNDIALAIEFAVRGL